jgi:hypothetical protein
LMKQFQYMLLHLLQEGNTGKSQGLGSFKKVLEGQCSLVSAGAPQ